MLLGALKDALYCMKKNKRLWLVTFIVGVVPCAQSDASYIVIGKYIT